ncbi:hypothetical protein AQJ43_31550 [Streptomyces avermitilis]|nr:MULTISPECIES: NACHT domain-containing protein [Streptomyces]KUN50760.1 hypothetical protein AQJ43_31550 [Streptomyces avermitilis]MYS96305.1 NACHT domain-containing protein [Streptomyces sp. SID5469]
MDGGYVENLIQAGAIHGGVHFHVHRPESPQIHGLLRPVAVLFLALAAVALIVSDLGRRRPGPAWTVAACLLVVAAYLGVAHVRARRGRRGVFSERQLDIAATQLAGRLRTMYDREERLSRVHDPIPLRVRWSEGDPELVDHWENISRDSGQIPDIEGEFAEINEVYKRIPSRRLVVLGPPGGGKSALALRFARQALKGSPVPVIFPLASWDPRQQGLWQWAAALVSDRHPSLAARGAQRRAIAQALLETGRILPVLDGFDEIPTVTQATALAEFNASLGRDACFVLTSRSTAFEQAVAQSDVLTATAVVELERLTVDQLAEYLPRTSRKVKSGEGTLTTWDPVLARLGEEDGQARHVRRALSTPLMVGLARAAYSDTRADPMELLDPRQFPDSSAIEAHLFDRFIPSVYGGALADRTWEAEQAGIWLRFLARHVRAGGTQELEWWRLDTTTPRWVGWLAFVPLIAAITGVTYWSGLGEAHATFWPGGPIWLTEALLFLALLTTVWFATDPSAFPGPKHVRGSRALPFLRSEPSDTESVSSPWELLRRDRTAAWVKGAFWVLPFKERGGPLDLFSLALFLILPITWLWQSNIDILEPEQNVGRVTLLLNTFAWLLYEVGGSAWGRFNVARIWLAATGRLPWRLGAFLQDAHGRGVLRQSGGRYRFRHLELLNRLAGKDFSQRKKHSLRIRRLAFVVHMVIWVGLVAWLLAAAENAIGPSGPYSSVAPACSLLRGEQLEPAITDPWARADGSGRCHWTEQAPFNRDGEVTLSVTVARPGNGVSAVMVADRQLNVVSTLELAGVGDRAVISPRENEPGSAGWSARVGARTGNVFVDLTYTEVARDGQRVKAVAAILVRQVLANAGLGESPGTALVAVPRPPLPGDAPYTRYRRGVARSIDGPVWRPGDRSQLNGIQSLPFVFRGPRMSCAMQWICGIGILGHPRPVYGIIVFDLRECTGGPCSRRTIDGYVRDPKNKHAAGAPWKWADASTKIADFSCSRKPSKEWPDQNDLHCVEMVRAFRIGGKDYLLGLRTAVAKQHADLMRKTVNDIYTQTGG